MYSRPHWQPLEPVSCLSQEETYKWYYDRRLKEVNQEICNVLMRRVQPGYCHKITGKSKMWVTSMDFEVCKCK